MNCAQRRDIILLLPTGTLDAAEEQETRAHLATGCPTCAAHLAEAQAVWSQIPMGLAPVAPSPAAKDLLMIKVNATGPLSERTADARGPIPISQATRVATAPKRWNFTFAVSGIAAALAILFTYFTMNALIRQKDDTIAKINQQLQQRDHELGDINQELRNANSTINMLKNPATMIVKFGPADPAGKQPSARMLWNPQDNTGIFLASSVPQPAPGRCYELWIIVGNTPADKLAAGEITIDAHGNTLFSVAWKDPIKPAVFAVTDEPARPNITAPQGPITMLATAN